MKEPIQNLNRTFLVGVLLALPVAIHAEAADGGADLGGRARGPAAHGDDDRPDINNIFIQPFFAYYTWPSAWTASVQSETSYNWDSEQWSVPVNAALSKLVRFGKLPVSHQGGAGYWAESPDNGPGGCGFRL